MNKNKDIPVTGREDQYGFETSRIPGFLDNPLTDGSEFFSFVRRARFTR
jgi:hypothetical protein